MAIDLQPFKITIKDHDYPVKHNAMIDGVQAGVNQGLDDIDANLATLSSEITGQITTAKGELSAQITTELSAAVTVVADYRDQAASSATTATNQAILAAEKTGLTAADRVATLAARDEAVAASATAGDVLSTATQIITGDSVFLFNPRIIEASTILPAGFNAVSAGPLEIAEGVTITITDHSTWSIV